MERICGKEEGVVHRGYMEKSSGKDMWKRRGSCTYMIYGKELWKRYVEKKRGLHIYDIWKGYMEKICGKEVF